jgi:hypothetical protein
VRVDGAAARDQGIDVGDGHEDARRTAAHIVGDRELIEIARVVVVDRRPQPPAQIADVGRGRPKVGARLGQSGRLEIRKQATLEHGSAGDGFEVFLSRWGHRAVMIRREPRARPLPCLRSAGCSAHRRSPCQPHLIYWTTISRSSAGMTLQAASI